MSWQYLHWITFYNKIKAEAALCQIVTVVLEFVLNFKCTIWGKKLDKVLLGHKCAHYS